MLQRVMPDLMGMKNILVINDEAHHCYREKPKDADDEDLKGDDRKEAEKNNEAARLWISGLEAVNRKLGTIRVIDLSATPFAPTGRTNTEAGLFSWVVSDFGLNDAIEAGLVKTPRVVVRDDAMPNAQTLRPRMYHLYREHEVSDDLNRKGARPGDALPKLVQDAYTLLGADWREARIAWEAAGHPSPPVMLTVCNRTETAARIERYFTNGDAFWGELHDADRTLRVDSRVLEKAEIGESGQLHESDVSKFRIFAASFLSVWLNTKVGAVFAPAWIPFLRPGSRRSHSHGLGSADAFR